MPYPDGDLLLAGGPFLSRFNWRTGQWYWSQRVTADRVQGLAPLVPLRVLKDLRLFFPPPSSTPGPVSVFADPSCYFSLLPRDLLLLAFCFRLGTPSLSPHSLQA